MSSKLVFDFVSFGLLAFTPTIGFANDFFVNASAEFTGGAKVELKCSRAAGANEKSMKELFQPSMGNKENSYSLECVDDKRNFFGLFFKFNSDASPTTVEFKPFSSQAKLPLEKQFNVFTARVKTQDKELYIHSFPQLPQHYIGQPQLKVTSFTEEKDGASVFHVVSGEGSAEFNDTQMDGKSKNAAGKLSWKFKIRAKYIRAPR